MTGIFPATLVGKCVPLISLRVDDIDNDSIINTYNTKVTDTAGESVWNIVGQGHIALAVGAGGGCLDIFSLIYHFSFLSPSLWELA